MIYGKITNYGIAKILNVILKILLKFKTDHPLFQKPINQYVRLANFALYLFALGFTVPRIVISMRGMIPPGKGRS